MTKLEIDAGETSVYKRPTGADWIIPAAAAAFATYYLISIKDLVWEAKIAGVFVAVVLFLLLGIFAVRSALGVVRGEARLEVRSLYDTPALFALRLSLFAMATLSVLAIPWAGFTLSTFSFLLASFRFLARMSWRGALFWAAFLALFGYVLFIAILGTAFPRGPFENAVRWAVGG